jgi:predicted GIY-YIG superfamily endonuclease
MDLWRMNMQDLRGTVWPAPQKYDPAEFLRKRSEPCTLYRAFTPSGELLYVGISKNAPKRMAQHRKTSRWYHDAATWTFEEFASRAEAEQAEMLAIRAERPAHNIIGAVAHAA